MNDRKYDNITPEVHYRGHLRLPDKVLCSDYSLAVLAVIDQVYVENEMIVFLYDGLY